MAYVGKNLEHLVQEWENQAKIQPVLTDFISSQIGQVGL